MHKPVVVTVEHHITKQEMLQKLKSSFDYIRAQIAPYASSMSEEWTDHGVSLRVVALKRPIASSIEVDERVVRIEVRLPGPLGVFGGLVAARIRCAAALI